MQIINYPNLDEKVYYEKLENGLEVYLIPKNEYHEVNAVFTTKFGGLNHGYEIMVDGKKEHVIPGAAHFLEHRIFDYKGKDVLSEFLKLGASINAYTTLDRTCYFFNTSKNVNKSLNLLLDFVQDFNVSKKSVENEKKIIIQEAMMDYGEPGELLYRGIRECLFKNHPYRDEVIGDVDSINRTTYAHLKACHTKFYHPSNMFLVVIGKLDPTKTLELIKENQEKKNFLPKFSIEKKDFIEPLKINKKYLELSSNRSNNLAYVAYKLEPLDDYSGFERNKIEKIYEILLSMLYGKTSYFNQKMLKEKVYNNDCSYSYSNFHQMFYIGVSNSNVFNIDKFINNVKEVAKNCEKYLLGEKYFKDYKKVLLNTFISEFNNLLDLALEISSLLADDNDFFDTIDIIKSITYEDIVNFAKNLKTDNLCICVVKGENNG